MIRSLRTTCNHRQKETTTTTHLWDTKRGPKTTSKPEISSFRAVRDALGIPVRVTLVVPNIPARPPVTSSHHTVQATTTSQTSTTARGADGPLLLAVSAQAVVLQRTTTTTTTTGNGELRSVWRITRTITPMRWEKGPEPARDARASRVCQGPA